MSRARSGESPTWLSLLAVTLAGALVVVAVWLAVVVATGGMVLAGVGWVARRVERWRGRAGRAS